MVAVSHSGWLCCQLGAREHYVVPRALQQSGLLRELITDLWIRPGSVLRSLRSGLAGRFHPDLSSARVSASNGSAVTFALRSQITGATGWNLISKRNDWFQRFVADQIARDRAPANLTVFAYSYAAERIFNLARERGWRTVLGQIDPGPVEEDIVAEQTPAGDSSWQRAPREYWKQWDRECQLAHTIVVNSTWSRRALVSAGIRARKIRVVPLAFEPPAEASTFTRTYPNAFTSERPLRVLFLGQINSRKGAIQLFNAVKQMAGEPVEFWFVGPLQVDIPHELKDRIKWFGVAPRNDVARYYRDADVFILPTFSDGFGLTQLEAQAWKLPVIATPYCGDVVTNGTNGMILETVSATAIADVLHQLLRSPGTLQAMSENSRVDERFSLQSLATSLSSL
ncbi:MAG TPA: glycosyltransferase family 4 protein [Pyrinomonadaceae bacterium]|nr:glycosyltransferase family 4 protein [Pyrinomonadaceae bacterium]